MMILCVIEDDNIFSPLFCINRSPNVLQRPGPVRKYYCPTPVCEA